MIIENKFKKVFLEIESLEKKIKNQDYRSFFKSNKYNIESLISNINYKNIYNFTRVIGDNISTLSSKGQLSMEDEKSYRQERSRVDYELHRVHLLMEEDKRFWKNSSEIFDEFQEKIMNNLPFNPKYTIWKVIKRFFSKLFGKKPIYLKVKKG